MDNLYNRLFLLPLGEERFLFLGFHMSSHGFTLIEVLVSLMLLGLMIFSFHSMFVFSLRETRTSYYVHAATQQLSGMIERLIALDNHAGFQEQVAIWNAQNKKVLPRGRGEVKGQFPDYQVTIYWGDSLPSCKRIQWGQTGCISESLSLQGLRSSSVC
jgi:prepilin-type N-terminal cleavage/methylation domain-containing protein